MKGMMLAMIVVVSALATPGYGRGRLFGGHLFGGHGHCAPQSHYYYHSQYQCTASPYSGQPSITLPPPRTVNGQSGYYNPNATSPFEVRPIQGAPINPTQPVVPQNPGVRIR